jgi:hypothetical protein
MYRSAAAEEEVGSNAMPLQLAFEDLGDGPPVVVLHGLFGSSRNCVRCRPSTGSFALTCATTADHRGSVR